MTDGACTCIYYYIIAYKQCYVSSRLSSPKPPSQKTERTLAVQLQPRQFRVNEIHVHRDSCDWLLKSGYSLPIGQATVTGNSSPWLSPHSQTAIIQFRTKFNQSCTFFLRNTIAQTRTFSLSKLAPFSNKKTSEQALFSHMGSLHRLG
jgi:hypothetical protein